MYLGKNFNSLMFYFVMKVPKVRTFSSPPPKEPSASMPASSSPAPRGCSCSSSNVEEAHILKVGDIALLLPPLLLSNFSSKLS